MEVGKKYSADELGLETNPNEELKGHAALNNLFYYYENGSVKCERKAYVSKQEKSKYCIKCDKDGILHMPFMMGADYIVDYIGEESMNAKQENVLFHCVLPTGLNVYGTTLNLDNQETMDMFRPGYIIGIGTGGHGYEIVKNELNDEEIKAKYPYFIKVNSAKGDYGMLVVGWGRNHGVENKAIAHDVKYKGFYDGCVTQYKEWFPGSQVMYNNEHYAKESYVVVIKNANDTYSLMEIEFFPSGGRITSAQRLFIDKGNGGSMLLECKELYLLKDGDDYYYVGKTKSREYVEYTIERTTDTKRELVVKNFAEIDPDILVFDKENMTCEFNK